MVYSNGLMGLGMKVSGKKIKQMEKANLNMWTVMNTVVNGEMIRQMDLVFMCIQTVQGMKGIGKMINNMDLGKKNGRMDQLMKVPTKMGKRMGLEFIYGLIIVYIMAIGRIIK